MRNVREIDQFSNNSTILLKRELVVFENVYFNKKSLTRVTLIVKWVYGRLFKNSCKKYNCTQKK